MAKKIDRKLNDIDIVEKEFGDFLENGGEIGGTITFPKGITRQISQKIGLRSKDYTQRSGISNYNGYPCWATVIEDPDDDNNTNGLLFMLGSGSGDAYNDNYLRPLKMGYAQKNNIGSANVPWDDIFLKGVSKSNNGYTKLPNGIILQWGILTTSFPNNNVGTTSTGFISFPITFPNGIFSITSSIGKNVNSNSYLWGSVISCVMPITRLDGIQYEARINVGTGSNYNWQIHWMAIGY